MLFVIVGMGSLLPYNMFINASDYFNYKLRDVNSNDTQDSDGDKTKLQNQFESYFATCSTVSILLMVFG